MLKIFHKSIVDSFFIALFLFISTNLVWYLLDFKYYFYFFMIYIIFGALVFVFVYYKFIQKLLTKKTLVLFSTVSFFSFFVFLFIFIVIDIFIPFSLTTSLLPVRNGDISDDFGILLADCSFIFIVFVGRLITLVRAIRGRLIEVKK